MSTEEQLFKDALLEIETLREQNKIMSARLEMFDNLMSVLHTQPASRGYGLMHPDIVHTIKCHLASQEKEPKGNGIPPEQDRVESERLRFQPDPKAPNPNCIEQ